MILIRHAESHFNAHFRETREDPGIVDPGLTETGLRQAEAAAERLAAHDIRRIVASPYSRTLHTAEIIAERLGLTVRIDALVREHAYFTCDIGTPRSQLAERWPAFEFGDLPERWWPEPDESEAEVLVRCRLFREAMAEVADWPHLLVVSHWGFIRGLTGTPLDNAESIAFDPLAGASDAESA